MTVSRHVCSLVLICKFMQIISAAGKNKTWLQTRDNIKAKRGQELIDKMLSTYDSTLRPWKYGSSHGSDLEMPVCISVFLHILSLSSFNDVTMTFTVQFRLLQQWNDNRLSYNDSQFRQDDQLTLSPADKAVWVPDTFFQNEQYGHYHIVDQPNEFRRIRNDGQIQYSKRLTMNFSCPMNLMLFPHDTQTCYIEFSSYAYTTKDIVYEWGSPVPLQIDGIDYMPKFSLANVTNGTCNSVTATGNYSCLRVSLVLRREFSYFLLQLYLPSGMMVAVGCVSFWIDWRSAPARVPLAIVTLLTITTQSHGINASLPPVSYTKAIDLWIGACSILIFGALLEFAIVNYVGTTEERRAANMIERSFKLHANARFKQIMSDECCCDDDSDDDMVQESLYATTNNRPSKSRIYSAHRATDARWMDNVVTFFGLRRRAARKTEPLMSVQDQEVAENWRFDDEEEQGDLFQAQEYVAFRRDRDLYERLKHNIGHLASSIATNSPVASKAEKIDSMSRIIFPLGFIGFNIVYWSLYLPKMYNF